VAILVHVIAERQLPEVAAVECDDDSVWDLLAARALGVGLASGGYGPDELERAGAYRVYEDPLDLLNHLDEVGVRMQRQSLPEFPELQSR